MGKKVLILSVSLALLGMTAACTGSGCVDGRTGVPKAVFRSSASGATIKVDSLRISGVGAPGDSAVLTAGVMAGEVYLPLKSDASETKWCIAYKQKTLDFEEFNDTLSFQYDTTPYFVSDDCGVGFRYYINSLSCTNHLIDSVELLEPLVTPDDKAYVAIYFRTE